MKTKKRAGNKPRSVMREEDMAKEKSTLALPFRPNNFKKVPQ